MRSYVICYLNTTNRLSCKMVVMCPNATCAKVMAQAMKLPHHKKIEIWQGETKIYSRPAQDVAIAR